MIINPLDLDAFLRFDNMSEYGFPRYMSRRHVQKLSNGLLQNDQLKVYCEVSFTFLNVFENSDIPSYYAI